jgi:hypothetical protein
MERPNGSEGNPRKELKGIWGFFYQFLGPPVAQGDAISAHSPEGVAYRERQRAARKQAREQKRKKPDRGSSSSHTD